MSEVSVVVIDCTETGASPPTSTGLLWWRNVIFRDLRLGAKVGAGEAGSPKSMEVTTLNYP